MTRGLLAKKLRHQIDARLPDVVNLKMELARLNPALLAVAFKPNDRIPVATVCFVDWAETMAAVRVALFEYYAHGSYYRRKKKQRVTATYFEKFFLDDAALRLYAAGEHLANAVACMRNISDSELREHRERHTAKAVAVGKYLERVEADGELTKATRSLARSPDWLFTVSYRNRWVHEQPPTVGGLGLVYRRRLRWTVDEGRARLDITIGDEPELRVRDIARHILRANRQLIRVAKAAHREYLRILASHGVRRHENGWRITPRSSA